MFDFFYMKLIGWPIVFFSIELAQTKLAEKYIGRLSLLFIFESVISGIIFWKYAFSGPFLLTWVGHISVCPVVGMIAVKVYRKRGKNVELDSLEYHILGCLYLIVGLFCGIYSAIPDVHLFSNLTIDSREILVSRFLYLAFGMFSTLYGVVTLHEAKNKI